MTTAIPAEAVDHGDPKRYRRGCHCLACVRAATNDNRRRRYLRKTNRGTRRPAITAAAHINRLRHAGMTDADIIAASGLRSTDVLYRAGHGIGNLSLLNLKRILSVPVPLVPPTGTRSHACTDGTGTWRRLRALVAAGWPPIELGQRTGFTVEQVHYLLRGRGTGKVTLRVAATVKRVYLELWATLPESAGVAAEKAERARRLAISHKWLPAGVWDDIDDPADVPQPGARVSRVQAVVEDATELIAEGYSREAVAQRLGLTWDAVRQAYIRGGVPLPELAA